CLDRPLASMLRVAGPDSGVFSVRATVWVMEMRSSMHRSSGRGDAAQRRRRHGFSYRWTRLARKRRGTVAGLFCRALGSPPYAPHRRRGERAATRRSMDQAIDDGYLVRRAQDGYLDA